MGAFLDFRLKWQYQGQTGEIKAGQESLFQRAFVNLKNELMDWSPAFEIIAEDVLTPFVEQQFETQGAAGVDTIRSGKSSGTGFDWQELAESTVIARTAGRRAAGIFHRANVAILNATGLLKGSFERGGAQHEEIITPKKLIWGSRVPYALFHQTGTGKGYQRERVPTGPGTGRGMPMRKILSLTEQLKHKMGRTMTGRISQVARQIGFRVAGRDVDAAEAARIGKIALGLRA